MFSSCGLTRVAAADDRDRLVAEHGRRAVADRAGRDALVPEAGVLVAALERQPARMAGGGAGWGGVGACMCAGGTSAASKCTCVRKTAQDSAGQGTAWRKSTVSGCRQQALP